MTAAINRFLVSKGVGPMALLALVAVSGILLSAGLTLALHILQPEFDPITRAMSDYVHSPHGWLMIVAFVVLGLSLISLAGAFRYVASSTLQEIGVILLAAAGVCLVIAGIFPIDNTPDGSFNTVPGAIHAVAGHLLSPLVVAAMLLLSGPLNQPGDSSELQGVALALAILNTIAFVMLLFVNLIVHLPFGGLGQRVFMGLVCCWLVLSAIRLFVAKPIQVL